MLKIVNAVDTIVGSRLVELLSQNAHWHRSLWSVSVGLGIAELLEACAAFQAGTLSEKSLRELGSSCIRMAGKDPVLSQREKGTLSELLQNVPRLNGLAFNALQQFRERIERDYLVRWAREFRAASLYQPERAARSVASYLLDRGFSETFLHAWFKSKLEVDPKEWTLSELCEEADSGIASKGFTEFDVLIAFRQYPRSASGYPPGWLTGDQVSWWLKSNGFSVSGIRTSGGLISKVESRDAFAAADTGIALADGYIARASIATDYLLEPLKYVWVKGHPDPFPYQAKRRGVRVRALYREDQIFSAPRNSNVDAAIELLAHLENSSPTAAVAGGWGAIEALLGEPGDRSAAADSLASLVACSIPRAELTLLSYVVERSSPPVAPSLHACGKNNRDRAALIAQLIASGSLPRLPRYVDHAAVERMREVLRNPSQRLAAIRNSVSEAFHRLYRQRNLILHGGITKSVALPPSLRTASKLAGAGIDRVAHGFYVQNLRPLELAARAKLAISFVQPMDPSAVVDLLGA